MRPLVLIAALAAPAAAESVDVDGDGRADVVRIEAPGQIVVERAGGGGAFVPFGQSGALGKTSLSFGTGGRPFVVATAQIGNAWEAVVLRWQGGAMKEVWRGPVGPATGDAAEFETWVEARPAGLVRWQTRRDLQRCDGGAVELFREGWDDAAGKFRAARPAVRFPDKMAAVTATAAGTGSAGGGWYKVSGASTSPGAEDAGQLLAPRALDDGDPATVWREDRGSDGSGEMFWFRAGVKGGKAAALQIVLPPDGNRVTSLVVLGPGAAVKVELPRATPGTRLTATLPAPIDGCVNVVIAGVAKGGSGNVTGLAELVVVSDVELAPGGAERLLAEQVARGGLAGESAARALATRGPAAVTALSSVLAGADAATRPRLLSALSRIQDPAVIAPVAAALAAGELPAGDIVAAAERLASFGEPGEAALVELLRGTKVAQSGRIAAARVLGRKRPLALAEDAGRGSPAARAELTTLVAGAGTVAILGYLRGDKRPSGPTPLDEPARADLWRAVGKAALTASEPDRLAAAAAMADALEASADGEYELRYRLVGPLGELGGDAEVGRLMAWLRRPGPGDTARARALRRVAATGLGINPRPSARRALAELAADPDAGTRLTAVRGLAVEPTGAAQPDDLAARDAADAALAALLARDAWPEIRRGAAAALGLRCDRGGPRTALETAVGADAELDVRADALTALVTCRATGIAARLLRLADDGKTVLALRDRAVALYGQLHEPAPGAAAPAAAVDALLDRLERWRGQAFSDEAGLRLAVRAATALGGLGDRRAAAPLMAAARDGTFPELQAAAAAALGSLGPACPRDARTLLRALAQSEQRGVALAARGAIDRCGK